MKSNMESKDNHFIMNQLRISEEVAQYIPQDREMSTSQFISFNRSWSELKRADLVNRQNYFICHVAPINQDILPL
jgi:hypothetical protein